MFRLPIDGGFRIIRGMGLDTDGVLRDSGIQAYQATCQVIQELGGKPPGHADFVRDFNHDMLHYYRSCGAQVESIEDLWGKYLPLISHDELSPFPDVAAFFEVMRRPATHFFGVSSHPEKKLRPWFDQHGILFSSFKGGSKNKTICITEVCARLDIDPRQTIYVGDWGLDMRESRKAGCIPIGITRGYDTRQALIDCGAHIVVEHLSELTNILEPI